MQYILIVLALGLLVFVVHHIAPLFVGPVLSVTSPLSGETYQEPLLYITGTTKRAVHMTINGHVVLVREDGVFEVPIVLIDGINTLHIQIKDKFGRKNVRELIIFKIKEQPYDIDATETPSPSL